MTLEQETSAYLIEYGKQADKAEYIERMRARTCRFCGKSFDMGRGWTDGEYYLCNACYESLTKITDIEEEPEL